MDRARGIIVVGVDGGPAGDAALRFAVEESAQTGDSIEVVTAWEVGPLPAAPYAGSLPTMEDLRLRARMRQDAALARTLGDPPMTTVAGRVLRGDAGTLLVESARHARLLVVGSRPMGPLRAVLLGSVSRYCAHHAACPVVVVPAAASSESGPMQADEVVLTHRP